MEVELDEISVRVAVPDDGVEDQIKDGDWRGDWEAHRSAQMLLWSQATAAQRLEWLEQALALARQAGALRRPP